ncbi:hypothetical protein [Streptomyces sp. NPDC002580]|uniref:hypothetical protein n=1 Tax=Streptomyces sp. NPDC002580 TaxID=3364653 RepID=UPI0036841FAB
MPAPAPPKRGCTRFNADGTPCTTRTARGDGWCGGCDGYTARTPNSGPGKRARWQWGAGPWRPGLLGLEPDEAYEIEIHPRVVNDYSAHHTVSPNVAVVQIRSLLEDLITSDAPTEIDGGGYWRILLPRDSYGLMLSPDRGLILRYCTRHRERTWAQYRSGVLSRISYGGSGGAAWRREALAEYTTMKVGGSAFHGFARHILGVKTTRDNVDEVARQFAAYLNEHVLPRWDRTTREAVDDGRGVTWILAVDDQSPDGIVIANYATGSPLRA